MNYSQIAKQAFDFQKTAFTNWCTAVAMIQNQAVSAMVTMMSQSGLAMPEEAHKAIKIWVDACQEGFKSFPLYAEGGFFSLVKPLAEETKPVPAESAKLLAEEKKAAPAKSTKPAVEEKKAATPEPPKPVVEEKKAATPEPPKPAVEEKKAAPAQKTSHAAE